jgi:predicted nucleic acid-binding protein
MDILLDASAIIAVMTDEPEGEKVVEYTHDAVIISPSMMYCEIANALTRMMRRKIITSKKQMVEFMKNFKLIPIKTVEPNIDGALEIAWDYKIYAYDAFYLEIAKRLKLPLLTFDNNMRKIGSEIGITVLGE